MLAPTPSHSKSNVEKSNSAECRTYHFRCPSCQKLYAAQSDQLKGAQAEFECIKCYKHFAFKLPAGGYSLIPTFIINKDPEPQLKIYQPMTDPATESGVLGGQQFTGELDCPKCGATNTQDRTECWKCQVILAKVRDLPLELGRNASPAVVALWKQVLEDIDRPALHNLFLKECERRDQMSYAVDRYQRISEAQPQDAVLASYLIKAQKVERQLKYKNEKSLTWIDSVKKAMPPLPVFLLLPVVVSLALIIAGLSHVTMRNLVGLGAAILVLYIGALLLFWNPPKREKSRSLL